MRIGIVGLGIIGKAHTETIRDKISNMKVTAICSTNPDKANWVDENIKGAVFFTDYKMLVQSGEVDAVLVCTPHYSHYEIATFAFENGLHVLMEKPAGVYTKRVKEMNDAAIKSGKVYSMMYNQRMNPYFRKIREIIQTGQLGELKRFNWIVTDWYRSQAYFDSSKWRGTWEGEGGGVLINQCFHNLDLWQWLIGMPKTVNACCKYGKYHDIEVEDEVTAYAEYANGVSATLITSTGEAPGTNRLEIAGDKGRLVYECDSYGVSLVFNQLTIPEREYCYSTDKLFGGPTCNKITYDINEVDTMHAGILQNFANAILHGEELVAPGVDGINALELCNAIHLADWTRSRVKLPLDTDKFYEMLNEKRRLSISDD